MGMFKIDWSSYEQEKQRLNENIGYDIRDLLRKELETMKSYYSENASEQIKYYLEDNVVGSTEWAATTINQGRLPGEWPNIDRIRDWVRTRKDGGKYSSASDAAVNSIAYAVSKKIKDKGIAPKWYVDKVLQELG